MLFQRQLTCLQCVWGKNISNHNYAQYGFILFVFRHLSCNQSISVVNIKPLHSLIVRCKSVCLFAYHFISYCYYHWCNFLLHYSNLKTVKSSAMTSEHIEKMMPLTYRPQPPSGSCTERRYRTISFLHASARGIFATWHVIRRPGAGKKRKTKVIHLGKWWLQNTG